MSQVKVDDLSKGEAGKFDPEANISIEDLAKIDFSNKPETLKKLDAELAAGEALRLSKEREAASDPFKSLYILTYKGEGPISHVFFRSLRPSVMISRDCQIYCKARGIRYISHKPALINLFAPTDDITVNGNNIPAGDITDLVTRQSRLGKDFDIRKEVEASPL